LSWNTTRQIRVSKTPYFSNAYIPKHSDMNI
jgi:hypothetical protein